MRKILIDTDTASDDAVALVMALREPTVQVQAITVVAGNVAVDQAVKNALNTVDAARTYAPPVYRGAARPLMRDLLTAEDVHGADGMGDMDLPAPSQQAAPGHAIDHIIEVIQRHPGEVEMITLGPLTNLALAYLKEPDIAQQVRRVVVMGGSGLGPGNMTPVAEFNLLVDAEAAHIVLESGMPLMFVGWDVSTDETFLSQADLDALLATGSDVAAFCVRCNRRLHEYNREVWGRDGVDLPDPTAVAAALFPEIITHQMRAYCQVEYRSQQCYGQLIIDQHNLLKREPNAELCLKIDAAQFKQHLFRLVQ